MTSEDAAPFFLFILGPQLFDVCQKQGKKQKAWLDVPIVYFRPSECLCAPRFNLACGLVSTKVVQLCLVCPTFSPFLFVSLLPTFPLPFVVGVGGGGGCVLFAVILRMVAVSVEGVSVTTSACK